MSSIMRWRNGLMGLSVMAITPVSHEVSEPHDLETGRAVLFIPTSNPPRARSRWGVYRESGLVHGSEPALPRRASSAGRQSEGGCPATGQNLRRGTSGKMDCFAALAMTESAGVNRSLGTRSPSGDPAAN